jgi:hypothetical protein
MYNTNRFPTAALNFSVVTADSPDPYTGNDSENPTFPIPAATLLSRRGSQR